MSVATYLMSRPSRPLHLAIYANDQPSQSTLYQTVRLVPICGQLRGAQWQMTGPCLCGFDRFARDEMGRWVVGFSVGGGVTGPGYTHRPCDECKRLAGDRPIRGTHAALFTGATR